MSALTKIKSAGFSVSLVDGDYIEVSPSYKLTHPQREFLKQHKAEIISELSIGSLTAEDETKILVWLDHIGETDPGMIAETLADCRTDPETKAYLLGRAHAAASPVMDVDGCLKRKEAGMEALKSARVYVYRHKEKPDSDLIAIMPGTTLIEARSSLVKRYGDDLLSVREQHTTYNIQPAYPIER